MADTIDAFVKQLRDEGVEAGRAEADKLVAAAKDEAAAVVAAAEKDAAARREAAEKDAAQLLVKAKADLALAIRDTVARLRTSLAAILEGILAKSAGACLADPKVVGDAIVALVKAHAGAEGVAVQDAQRDAIVAGALAGLAGEVADGAVAETLIKGGYEQPGFSYSVDGATVAVDVQSVVEHLGDMVNPALREAISAAMAEGEA